ncbi:MAG: hypothetical protein ACKO6B_02850 [Planctomycetia bacterium]
MGGQACVFYGAAQVSKDIDFLVLAEPENFARLQTALAELRADRIAVPPFDPAALARGHAVHFRCRAPAAEGLRVDVMTRLRETPEFQVLWERRTTFVDGDDVEYHLLCIPDLVQAKKTQRSRDWPVIELLVTIHYREHGDAATDDRVAFWLREARTPELLVEICRRFPAQATELTARRPLIRLARERSLDDLRTALDAEVRAVQARDRDYWEPLRRELEEFRRAHRDR